MKKVFGWHNHNMRVASKQQALAYFFFENGLVSGLHRVVAQVGRTAPRLVCFQNWCHLEKQDGHHLEILFEDAPAYQFQT